MTWGHVTVNVEKVEGLIAYLGAMENRVQDFSAPLYDGAKLMRVDVLSAIDSGGASIGLPWPAHTSSTVARWGEHPLLKNPDAAASGGMLYDRIYFKSHPFAAVVFTDDPIANILEHGRQGKPGLTKGGKIKAKAGIFYGDMPARDPFWITNATQDAIIDLVLNYAITEQGGE